jgi:hypothetical protein
MTLTKSQKIYGAAMLVAAGAFVWDRATSGPAPVEASAPRKETPALLETSSLITIPELPADRNGLSQRLSSLARQQCLDAAAPDNAFGIPPEWLPEKPAPVPTVPVVPAEVETNKRLAEAFRSHRLDAVMVGLRGYANVDGQGVFIGETFDKFTLLSVTKSSAIFGLDGVQVELRLAVDAKINRKGGVIDNASPRRGDGGPRK